MSSPRIRWSKDVTMWILALEFIHNHWKWEACWNLSKQDDVASVGQRRPHQHWERRSDVCGGALVVRKAHMPWPFRCHVLFGCRTVRRRGGSRARRSWASARTPAHWSQGSSQGRNPVEMKLGSSLPLLDGISKDLMTNQRSTMSNLALV